MLTTHDLADVERLCRRIVLIDHGTLIYDGDVERIKSEYGRFARSSCVSANRSSTGSSKGRELVGVEDAVARFRFDRNRSGRIFSCGKRASDIASKT